MDGIICSLFHELTVTLGAEFCPCSLEQFFIVRSVCIMTGETVAVLHGFVHNFFTKIGLRIGMAREAYFIRPVFQQTGVIRPVGIMAGGAHRLSEGRVPVLEFQCILCFFMTSEAETRAFRNEQMFILGGMGPMTRETALPAFDWRMAESDLLPFVRMAAKTEFVPVLHQEFRVLGGMGVVALDTHAVLEGRVLHRAACLEIVSHVTLSAEAADIVLFRRKGFLRGRGVMAHVAAGRHDWIVRACLHEFWLLRGVGIMTGRAGFCLNGIASMGRLERRLAGVMTGQAERNLRLDEEIRLIGAVREVAHSAPLRLYYFVYRFLFKVLFFVALITDLFPLRLEQLFRLGGMRVMADGAFTGLQGRMYFCLVRPYLFLAVTLKTKVVPRPLQEKFGDDAVPQMTAFALFLLYDRMHLFHPEILVREFCMAVQAILAGEFFPLRRTGPCVQNDAAQEKNRTENANFLFCTHAPHHHLPIS